MTLSDTFDKVLAFVRPTDGPRLLGQAHVPLLALMPRSVPDAGPRDVLR
jgi:hypothetical protein